MTRFLTALCLSQLAAAVLFAKNTTESSKYQPATITSVQRQAETEPAYSGGDNPSDAPLESQYYAYNVGVKTSCGTYVTRFESPYDYLPSAFSANRALPVRVGKNTMNFDLGYRQMQMNIIHRRTDKSSSCSGQN
jgi:hypothetical protein